MATNNTLSNNALALILKEEGLDSPPDQPGGPKSASGVTIGIGYDLRFAGKDFVPDWREYLPAPAIERLSEVVGLSGMEAARAVHGLRDIKIGRAEAEAVFKGHDVPREIASANQTLPGSSMLPSDAFGALVSIGFNRGWSLNGSSRVEMRAIKEVILDWREMQKIKFPTVEAAQHALDTTLAGIAQQIRGMKHLWFGQSIEEDMTARREHEAKLVESCIGAPEIVSAAIPQPGVSALVTCDVLRVRAQPAITAGVLGTLLKNSTVHVTDQSSSDWWKIQFGRKEAWASAKYLQASREIAARALAEGH